MSDFFHPDTEKIVSRVEGARLACVMHTASVNPELGSNSSHKSLITFSKEEKVNNYFKECDKLLCHVNNRALSLLHSRC